MSSLLDVTDLTLEEEAAARAEREKSFYNEKGKTSYHLVRRWIWRAIGEFQDRTSSAGAKGLMQILPSTAQFIARKSGGTAFELRDLGTPQINISYGAWYLSGR